MKKTNIDFIGDIHGHAEELEKLLEKMWYSKRVKTSLKAPQSFNLFCGRWLLSQLRS